MAEQEQLRARAKALQLRAQAQQRSQNQPEASPPSILDRADILAGDVSRGMRSFYRSLLEGAMLGASGEALALTDTATGRGPIEQTLAARDAELESAPAAIRTTGEVLGGVATGGLAGAGKALLPQLARSAGIGGIYGFNAAKGGVEERLPGAAVGAGAALVGEGAMRGLGRVISPQSTPQVQQMRNMGVTPTPGQTMGGAARTFEEKMSSVPLLGSAIRAGETRTLRQFNIGAVNKALAPAGLSLPAGTQPGREAVDTAINLFDDAYGRAIPSNVRVPYTQAMRKQMEAVSESAADLLDDAGMRVIQGRIRKITQPGSSGGTEMTGARAQEIISDLRKVSRKYNASQMASEQNIGEVIDQIEDVFQKQLEQSLPPGNADALKGINRAYANWKRLERTASTLGAEEGVFTPAQLQNAVRAMDSSVDRRSFARGRALMQDTSEAGKAVLGRSVPNSGTVDRGLATGAVLSTGVGVIDPTAGVALATSLGVPSLAYTPWGQRLLASILAGRQGAGAKATAAGVRQLAPAVGTAAAIGTTGNR